MSLKTLFIFNSFKLFEILNEINFYLNFKIQYIDKKKIAKIDFSSFKDHLIISFNNYDKYSNYIKINKSPISLDNLLQIINLNFIKKQYAKQSIYVLGKYSLNLNSRVVSYKKTNLDLTEKEIELLLFINQNKKANLKMIQKNVWKHVSELETHTVETHIYRLRKKIRDNFQDENFIGFANGKYFLR